MPSEIFFKAGWCNYCCCCQCILIFKMHGFWELRAEISVVSANSNLEKCMCDNVYLGSQIQLQAWWAPAAHRHIILLLIYPYAQGPSALLLTLLCRCPRALLWFLELLKGRAWFGVWRPVGEPHECVCCESRQGGTEGLSHSSAEEGTFQKEESEDLKKNQPKRSSSGENGYVV